jgi:PAS domain S-box-containing protein
MLRAVAGRTRSSKGDSSPRSGPYWRARGLYEFIRAVLGDKVSDNEIARRWRIDARVFNDLKYGRIAVPRIERLRSLAPVLGVNEHFLYAIAAGAPWRRILAAARRGDMDRALTALAGSARKAEDTLRDTRRALEEDRARLAEVSSQLTMRDAELRALLEQLSVAVLTIDTDGRMATANAAARELFGLARKAQGRPFTLALSGVVLIDLNGEPFDPTRLPGYEALREGRAMSRTFRIHRRGQPPHVVAATASPIRDARSKLLGVLSVLRVVDDLFEGPYPTSRVGARSRRR